MTSIRKWGGARVNSGRKSVKELADTAEFFADAQKKYGKKAAIHPLAFGYDEMLNPNNPLNLRLRIMKTLLPYFAPKLMSIDTQAQEDHRLVVEYVGFPQAVQQVPQVQQAITQQPTPTADEDIILSDTHEHSENEGVIVSQPHEHSENVVELADPKFTPKQHFRRNSGRF